MTSAWETIRTDSRRSPRFRLSLSASVLIYEGIEEGHLPAVLGYTRDISRAGLCLIMPTAAPGYGDFNEGARALRITLALPTGASVEVAGTSVRCIPYKGGDAGKECLVGVKLNESEGLTNYHKFIECLSRR